MAQDEGELIRLALEQLPDGIVVADARDHVVTLNAQARLISGPRSDAGIAFSLLFAGSVTEDVEQGLGALVAFLAGKVARGVLGHAADVCEIQLDSEAG